MARNVSTAVRICTISSVTASGERRYVLRGDRFFSIVLLVFCSFLIALSAYRGDVGSDSAIYRQFYEQLIPGEYLGEIFSFESITDYRFEPLFLYVLDAFSLAGFSFELIQISVAGFSGLALWIFYVKCPPRTFIVFSLLYLAFIYWQLQWSVIRQCLAFWTLVAGVAISRSSFVPFMLASGFHVSALLAALMRFPRIILFLAPAGLLLVVGVFTRYAELPADLLYAFFFGGSQRFLLGVAVFFVLAYCLRLWTVRFPSLLGRIPFFVFIAALFVSLVVPLGWRLLAVTLPLVIYSNFEDISDRRLVMFVCFSLALFAYKTVSHMENMLVSGMEPEVVFIQSFLKDVYMSIF